MSTSEFQNGEPVTAVVHLDLTTGEAYSGPIVIGYYADGDGEIWIEKEGRRVGIPADHFKAVAKQLKRAHDTAKGAA